MTAVLLTLLLPVPIWMPVALPPEITLPGGVPGVAVSPPTCVAESPWSRLTALLPKKPSAVVPVTSVPMKLPATFTFAEFDPIPIAGSRELASILGAELVELPVGHCPHVEATEAFVRALDAFLPKQ